MMYTKIVQTTTVLSRLFSKTTTDYICILINVYLIVLKSLSDLNSRKYSIVTTI
jgi:hypothetical protein